MLFKPELAAKVLKGQKTQTRRTKKLGERLVTDPFGVKMVLDYRHHTKWEVGRTYAVQTGRGKPAVGRYRLLDIREEHLLEITEADALAEGITVIRDGESIRYTHLHFIPAISVQDSSACDSFFRLWDSINPIGLMSGHNPQVWVLVFEVVSQ